MYRRRGFVVFVTMDGNTRPRAGVPDWKFASYNFLRRNHWKVIIAGIDHMVYDNSRVKLVRHEIVPQSKLGQADHPTILAAFDVRRFFVRKSRKARKRNNKK